MRGGSIRKASERRSIREASAGRGVRAPIRSQLGAFDFSASRTMPCASASRTKRRTMPAASPPAPCISTRSGAGRAAGT
jgi:hypothetical protein